MGRAKLKKRQRVAREESALGGRGRGRGRGREEAFTVEKEEVNAEPEEKQASSVRRGGAKKRKNSEEVQQIVHEILSAIAPAGQEKQEEQDGEDQESRFIENDPKVLHRLERLLQYEVSSSDMVALAPLWACSEGIVLDTFLCILHDHPNQALLSIHDLLEAEGELSEELVDRDYFSLERKLRAVSSISDAFPELQQICIDLLVKHLRRKPFSSHDVCFQELLYIHGITPQRTYLYGEDLETPRSQPSQQTVKAVRGAFLRRQIHPEESGGFIDFLEASVLPVDPRDQCVRDVEVNTWEGMYDVVSGEERRVFGLEDGQEETALHRSALHKQRLAGLSDHYKLLQRKKRAQTIGSTLNKAIVIFGLYFVMMAVYSYLQQQAHSTEGSQSL